MIKPCCVWMDNLLATPGDKGFSVLAWRENDRRQFYLQARAFDRNFESRRDSIQLPKGVPIALSMDLPMRYCPYCGTNWSELIDMQRDAFDEYAASVAHLRS